MNIDDICRREDAIREALQDKNTRSTDQSNHECADRSLKGQVPFRYLGLTYINIGRSGIDWTGSHVKNQEWPAQLNHLFWVSSLARAYLDTADEVYVRAAREYITDWLDANSSGGEWRKAGYDGMLTVSIRVSFLLSTLRDFRKSRIYDDAFSARLVNSCIQQLRYLAGHMQLEGNQRIAHADSLALNGLRLAQFEEGRAWREKGVRSLNESLARQILTDGVHIEKNPGYHEWMTSIFDKYWRLSRGFPELGLVMPREKIAAMYDYELAVMRPNGALNAMHDCTGRHTGARPAGWRCRRDRFREMAGLSPELPATSQNFPAAGQACWRSSWEEDAVYVTFDATRWEGVHGHCHLSRNSVQVHAFGRSLLVDPGTLGYDARYDLMSHGKSTRAHNTVNLNGWNQSESDPDFRFGRADGYDLAAGCYTGGFWPGKYDWSFRSGHGPGLWATHHRTLLWVHGRFIAVMDRIMSDGAQDGAGPSLESNWQFSEGELRVDHDKKIVETSHADGNVWMSFPVCSEPGAVLSVHAGESAPPRGWLPGEGECAPAPQACLAVPVHTRWVDLAAVIIPFRGGNRPRVRVEGASQPVGTLRFMWEDGSVDTIYWAHQLKFALNAASEVDTDAALLHVFQDADGKRRHGLMVNGTYVSPAVTGGEGPHGLLSIQL